MSLYHNLKDHYYTLYTSSMTIFWQHSESFAVTNECMLDSKDLCDVTLLVGPDRQEIHCHKFILASRSPVLYTMFCGSLPASSVITIPDVEADVMNSVVRYIDHHHQNVIRQVVAYTFNWALNNLSKFDRLPLSLMLNILLCLHKSCFA